MDFKDIDKQISILNELRHKFWKKYRALRTLFMVELPKQWE